MRLGNFQTLSLDASAWGGCIWTPPSRKPPAPSPCEARAGRGAVSMELARLIGIPSPHSSVVGRGNRPAAWWWCQDARRLGIPRGSVRQAPQLSGPFRQRGAVRLNLPNRFNDVIHVPAVGQEQILGQPDRRRADLP